MPRSRFLERRVAKVRLDRRKGKRRRRRTNERSLPPPPHPFNGNKATANADVLKTKRTGRETTIFILRTPVDAFILLRKWTLILSFGKFLKVTFD